uniref:Uncharacterized protein n=1 Tax=Trichogramma kaykai TaxID=54128 RepID=A0ABD2X9J6_9HYME
MSREVLESKGSFQGVFYSSRSRSSNDGNGAALVTRGARRKILFFDSLHTQSNLIHRHIIPVTALFAQGLEHSVNYICDKGIYTYIFYIYTSKCR